MKQKIFLLLSLLLLTLTAGAQEYTVPILPSSRWTPEDPYKALVWIKNTGESCGNFTYKDLRGAPAQDANGKYWYELDYVPTSNEGIDWQIKPAPFCSYDDYYGTPVGTRWARVNNTAEIYMRRSFSLYEKPADRLQLAVGHDDGNTMAPSEWYINGVLVFSSETFDENEVYLLTEEQTNLIKFDGSKNVIAVHVHQDWGHAFADCGLYAPGDAPEIYSNKLLPIWDLNKQIPWPCKFKLLTNNSDITTGADATWAALDLDESDWTDGYGQFSIDGSYGTYWNSSAYPILIRRHFTMTSDEMNLLDLATVTVTCSYNEYPKLYLNGEFICSWNRWSDARYDNYELTAAQKALLREGDNVLAVSLQKGSGGGHIDYGLSFEATLPIVIDVNPPTPVQIPDRNTGSYLYTFVSPIDGQMSDADVYEFAGIQGSGVYGTLVEDGIIEAGKPYMYIANDATVTFLPKYTYNKVYLTQALDGEHGMRGVLADDVTNGYQGTPPYFLTENGTHLVFSGGGIKQPKSDGGTKIAVGRCYIDKSQAFVTAPAQAARRIGSFDEATGIISIVSDLAPAAKSYNLLGLPVGSDYKGLIITNGKKSIRK